MNINDEGLAVIQQSEGLRLEAYLCPAQVWTIGYGTTRGVTPGMAITKSRAVELLQRDVQSFEKTVEARLSHVRLNENQFSALVSLCYNCGSAPIEKGNTIRRALDAGDYQAAADGFLLWRKSGGVVLEGLVRRRQRERELFLKPVDRPDEKPPTRIIVDVALDTYLKRTTAAAASLPENKKRLVKVGSLLAGELIEKKDKHFCLLLEDDPEGGLWCAFEDHVEVLAVTKIA